MQIERLIQTALDGDLGAAELALRKAERSGDEEVIATLRRAIPAFAWAGCDYLETNEEGCLVFWHRRTGLRMIEVPSGAARLGPPESASPMVEVPKFLVSESLVPEVMFNRFRAEVSEAVEPDDLPGRWQIAKYKLLVPMWRTPTARVSWAAARAFALAVGGDLPSEGQWERFARGRPRAPMPAASEETVSESTLQDYEDLENMAGLDRGLFDGEPKWYASAWRYDARASPEGERTPVGVLEVGGGTWEWCRDVSAGQLARGTVPTYGKRDGDSEDHTIKGADRRALWRRWYGRRAASYIGFRIVIEPTSQLSLEDGATNVAGETKVWLAWHADRESDLADSLRPGVNPDQRELLETRRAQRAELAQEPLALETPNPTQKPQSWDLASELDDDAMSRFAADLEHLSAARIAAAMPLDKKGRVELKREIPLAQYTVADTPSRTKELWLVARTPRRRRDRQVISVTLERVNATTKSYVWHRHPWLWRTVDSTPAQRWGAAIDAGRVPIGGVPDHAHSLAERALLLLDDGHFEAAMALYNVRLGESLQCMLRGEVMSHWHLSVFEAYAHALHEMMRAVAPWRLVGAVARESRRIHDWARRKRSRKPRPVSFGLQPLPHQTTTRKDWLTLRGSIAVDPPLPVAEGRQSGTVGPDDWVELEVVETGTDYRLAYADWRRSEECELLRLGADPAASEG